MRSEERSFPHLGFPRETDSLCPRCVLEVRKKILDGETDWRVVLNGNPGQIKASLVERDGQVFMEKRCPRHGSFSDIISTDSAFTRRIESLFPGRDFRLAPDDLHEHGRSAIRYGRGAVLTVDLTNRCNMMCTPCFMDANQVGYVHELTFEDTRKILDDAIRIKPRRQLSVQFSGGEPTICPFFLDAVRYARDAGYFSIQCATNGIRFALSPEFAHQAAEAGLRLAYLQFDGVSNESHEHRGVKNLFDVKQRAIDNLKAAGIDVTLVMTVVNTLNDNQVGPVVKFAAKNIDKINAVSFQPISFSGRDEEMDEETRRRQRYTLAQLAHDVQRQTGVTEPMRDWFPLSATGPVTDLIDHLAGENSRWGALKCGCHPSCGIGTLLLVSESTGEVLPLSSVLNVDRLLEDFRLIADSRLSRPLTVAQAGLAVARNFRAKNAPRGLTPYDLLRIVDGHTGRHLGIARKPRHEWRLLLVAGMWFQDLFTYDFRRTEMCVIPYGTQLGEVSFCAYNTGIGFRHIVEKLFRTASTAEWFKTVGRHRIYAGGATVSIPGEEETPRVPVAEVKSPSSGDSDGNGREHSDEGNGRDARETPFPVVGGEPPRRPQVLRARARGSGAK
jgi:uncharacterized radical SAM superfamily Fe-S cluster-containing enzyme